MPAMIWVMLACRQDTVSQGPTLVERYETESEAVIAEVRAMGDPIAQEVAVLALCESWPGQTAALCKALPEGAARSRCERFNTRPHLWSIKDSSASASWTGWVGSGRLGLPAAFLTTWDATPPAPGACEITDHACLEDAAHSLAEAGDVEGVAGVCNSFTGRLADDCFFTASELLPYGPDLYTRAMPLCAGGGDFGPECHGHLLLRMRAGDYNPLSAERLEQEANSIRQFWFAREPSYAPHAMSLYWSTAASRTLGTAQPFPVSIFDSLPANVHPHIRSAIALRVTGEAEPLATAYAVLSGGSATLPLALGPGAPMMPPARLWRGRRQGEPELSRIFFNDVRGGQRPVHPDASTDLGLAVLTACAMRQPPRLDVLEDAYADLNSPLLRWAAVRLLSEVSPNHPILAEARQSSEPLLVGAAAGR
ncbi:MAG: hypothetical protein ACI8RZ_005482 [Myxococcota bacterium]|jgi:hypothetical protein